MNASAARASLYRLLDQAADTHERVHITGKRNSGVLVSAEDWAALQEALYLLSVPGLGRSVRKGVTTPTRRLAKKLPW
jgi:antitoxin YefM